MPTEPNKPSFEPPPWEREAFDRFRAERAQVQASEELDQALEAVRDESAAGGRPKEAPEVLRAAPSARSDGVQQPVVPEARVNAMLVQLRTEEPRAPKTNMALVNAVVVFLAISGLAILARAAVLFADVQATAPATKILAATMSVVVLMTGLGFLGVATMLFRKYHT